MKSEALTTGFTIFQVRSAADIDDVRELFRQYVDMLGLDLGFQDFDTEFASLPGKYAPPKGSLLLAKDSNGKAIGCVALRPISPEGCCEMKRLYVSPEGRGMGLGTALIDAIIEEGKRIGYQEMKLDTLPTLTQAIALYEKAGFKPIAPYYDTPLKDTVFLGLSLF